MQLGSLESTQEARVVTFTSLLCSPNFPRALKLNIRKLENEPIASYTAKCFSSYVIDFLSGSVHYLSAEGHGAD